MNGVGVVFMSCVLVTSVKLGWAYSLKNKVLQVGHFNREKRGDTLRDYF